MQRWIRSRFLPGLPLGRDGRRVTAGPEHISLSRRAAREGMVLLKNEGGALPLPRGGKVALFGKAVIDYVADLKGPCYVRLGRGKVEDVFNEETVFDFTKVRVLKEGRDVVLFAMGLMVQEALKAAEELEKEGISCSVINVSCLKPLDKEGVKKALQSHKKAFCLEEHNVIGGLFSAVAETAVQTESCPVYPIGVEDTFGESGPAAKVLKKYGICAEHVVEVVKAH